MSNTFLVLLLLGFVQGVAEFIPISSSGHLVLLEQLGPSGQILNSMGSDSLLFINVMLHLATLVAVIIYLRREILYLVKGVLGGVCDGDFRRPEVRTAGYIIAASLPAGIIGLLFHGFFESLFSSATAVFFMLIINGFILISTKIIPIKDRKLEQTGFLRSLAIGVFQAIAILPGISRSGMTITGGMLSGLKPEESARFSFLIALPVIAGASGLEFLKAWGKGFPTGLALPLAASALLTVAVALVSLKVLFAVVRKVRIDIFGYYTILAGLAGIAYTLWR